jgi:hypothetical protein
MVQASNPRNLPYKCRPPPPPQQYYGGYNGYPPQYYGNQNPYQQPQQGYMGQSGPYMNNMNNGGYNQGAYSNPNIPPPQQQMNQSNTGYMNQSNPYTNQPNPYMNQSYGNNQPQQPYNPYNQYKK